MLPVVILNYTSVGYETYTIPTQYQNYSCFLVTVSCGEDSRVDEVVTHLMIKSDDTEPKYGSFYNNNPLSNSYSYATFVGWTIKKRSNSTITVFRVTRVVAVC
jgi:hypothetical protein